MNDLLLWMSVRESGSAQSFRERCAALPSTAQHARRSMWRDAMWTLEKLGHAEFGDAAGAGWRIAPPVLAARSGARSVSAILCGARTPALVAELAANCENLSVDPQDGAPDRIEMRAEDASELVAAAARANVQVQWEAPTAILSASAPIQALELPEVAAPVSAGWVVSRFSKSRQIWVDSTKDDAVAAERGFFRFRGAGPTLHMLVEDGKRFGCSAAVGKYRVMTRRDRAMFYNSDAEELAILLSCRPPDLIERALALCSGRLPDVSDGRLLYSSVSYAEAAAAAALLGQRTWGRRRGKSNRSI